MNDLSSRIVDGDAARQALASFVRPALDALRADYLAEMAQIAAKPLNNDLRAAIEKLALAIKVANEVQSQIEAIASDGKIALHDQRRADAVAGLSAERRRWI